MSTPISGIVNRTGVDLVRAAGSTLAATVARGLGTRRDGSRDVVGGLLDTNPVVVLVGTGVVVAASVLPEQADTMVVARSATTGIVRPGRWRQRQGDDSRSA